MNLRWENRVLWIEGRVVIKSRVRASFLVIIQLFIFGFFSLVEKKLTATRITSKIIEKLRENNETGNTRISVHKLQTRRKKEKEDRPEKKNSPCEKL